MNETDHEDKPHPLKLIGGWCAEAVEQFVKFMLAMILAAILGTIGIALAYVGSNTVCLNPGNPNAPVVCEFTDRKNLLK